MSTEEVTTAEEAKTRGTTAWKDGNVDEAVVWFSKAIELDMDNASGQLHVHYSNRSAAFMKQENASAALLDADRCVEVNPSWAKGYSRLGTALFHLGRYEQAAAAYAKGLEREPANVELRKNLLEARRQHTAREAADQRAALPRETLKGYFKKHPSLTLQFALRAFLLANWVIFLLPLHAASRAAYKRLLLAAMGANLLGLFSRHGKPRLNTQYMSNLAMDPSSQAVMTVLLFIVNRPYLVGIVPIIMLELTDFLWFLSGLLQMTRGGVSDKINYGVNKFGAAVFGIPNWASRSVTDRWTAAKAKASEWSAWVEVMFGMVLVAELLLPRRNLVMLALYWQTLRMKYMLNNATGRGYTKAAFRTLDRQIVVLTSKRRCPHAVGVMYNKLKGFLAKMVEPPTQGGASASPRCTIM